MPEARVLTNRALDDEKRDAEFHPVGSVLMFSPITIRKTSNGDVVDPYAGLSKATPFVV